MKARTRIHRSNVLTAEQAATVSALREQLQREKPSLDQAVASGEYQPPVTTGEYFDIVTLLKTLKDLRLKSGLSLRECAEISGVDFAALSRLENGITTNPTVHTLARCARALGKRMEISLVDAERPIRISKRPQSELPKSAFTIGKTEPSSEYSGFWEVGSFTMTAHPFDNTRVSMDFAFLSRQYVPAM